MFLLDLVTNPFDVITNIAIGYFVIAFALAAIISILVLIWKRC